MMTLVLAVAVVVIVLLDVFNPFLDKRALMERLQREKPDLWAEDIGE